MHSQTLYVLSSNYATKAEMKVVMWMGHIALYLWTVVLWILLQDSPPFLIDLKGIL